MSKKIALLMGLNYRETRYQLNGCINDAMNIKKLLKNKYQYQENEIILMTDDTAIKPTKNNIINTLSDVIGKINNEGIKQFFLFYSGHGTNVHDYSSDEDDRKDEVIVPLDVNTGGYVKDDNFYEMLKQINDNCVTFCLFDCCNSGTAVDLKYNHQGFLNYSVENAKSDMTNHIFMISGCKDVQTSVDAYNWQTQQYEGVLTSAFIKVNSVRKHKMNYFELVRRMRKVIKKRDMKQVPQLTSSVLIDRKTFYRIGKNHLLKNNRLTQKRLKQLHDIFHRRLRRRRRRQKMLRRRRRRRKLFFR